VRAAGGSAGARAGLPGPFHFIEVNALSDDERQVLLRSSFHFTKLDHVPNSAIKIVKH